MGVLLASVPGFVYRDGWIELPPESLAVVELSTRPRPSDAAAGRATPPAAE